MKKITILVAVLMLAGCASAPKPSAMSKPPVVVKGNPSAKKSQEPCPCSPTANQVVKKRWFEGWKIRFVH